MFVIPDMDITLDVSKLNPVDPTHILSELAKHVSFNLNLALELSQSQIIYSWLSSSDILSKLKL